MIVTTLELLADLRSRGVELRADGDHLRFSAPAGALTPALRGELAARKHEVLDYLQQAASVEQSPPRRTARPPELPLSFAQERMWFAEQLAAGPVYNVPLLIRLRGPLDATDFEAALDGLVARHEALRTTLKAEDGQPRQVISDAVRVPVQLHDLRQVSAVERDARIQHLAELDAATPFDLAAGPLLRAQLIRLTDDEHVLMLTFHHAITDGWSMGVIIGELGELYLARREGRPDALDPVALQYADYALWQREHLSDARARGQLSFWRERLDGMPAVLELPTDRPRPAVQSYRGASVSRQVDPELKRGLQRLADADGATLFMLLLAAYQTLLARYSGQPDVAVGTPAANRGWRELERVVGLFANTVVVRADLSDWPAFDEVLRRVKDSCVAAYAHQDVPFEKVVDELRPERDPSYNPLVQTMLVLDNQPRRLHVGDLELEFLDPPSTGARMDLALLIGHTAEHGLLLRAEYSTDLFDAATVERLLDHYASILRQVVDDPHRRVRDLDILTARERQQVLVEWNQTASPYRREVLFPQVFEEHAAARPDALAVVFGDTSLTYADLNTRANQLAHHLRELGVGPETRVALSVERSLDLCVGLLGILKAGGVYVPLDPAYPPDRLSTMLDAAAPTALLTQSHLLDRFSAFDGRIVCLDTDWATIAGAPPTTPECLLDGRNLAYMIFTSGSTGRPKGVLLHHAGLASLIQAQVATFGLQAADHVLQFHSMSFDGSVFEMVWALAIGATLYSATRDALLPGPALASFLREHHITVAALPPVGLAAMQDAEFADLHTLCVAGEACEASLVARWARGRRFFNLYGPTETTVWATSAQCSLSTGSPPIGAPVANATVYVLDQHVQPVPIGVPGELYIGGHGVARGYLNRPDLTAERFVPDPFGRTPGARLYRSGDLVRWRADGSLEFLGRLDHQVKIRGFRIELGEIEAALTGHAGVQDAVVVARQVAAGDKRLVAYVVPADAMAAPTSHQLREHLRTTLPEYMLPSAIMLLPALPLSPNGKVDRTALPEPELGDHRAYVGPRTPTERLLADIWSEVLGIPAERVGIHDNFFDLGGDSILTIRVAARAGQAGVQLTPRHVFQYQTISELACLDSKEHASGCAAALRAPLTRVQERLLADEPAVSVRVDTARLAPDLLERALQRVVDQHAVFRMRLVHEAGGPSFEEARAEPLPIRRLRLFELLPAQREDCVAAAITEACGRIDLEAATTLGALLLEVEPGSVAQLILVASPVMLDVRSWSILLEDLERAYLDLSDGREAWSSTYVNAPAARADDDPAARLEWVTRLTPEDTRRLLERVPAAYNTRPEDALLTALALACGEPMLQVDLLSSARDRTQHGLDLSRTLGQFDLSVPLQLVADPSASPGDSLKAIKEQVRSSSPDADSTARVSLQFQAPLASATPAGLLRAAVPRRAVSRRPLHIEARIEDGCLQIEWTFDPSVVPQAEVVCLVAGFERSLWALIEHCEAPEAGGSTPSDFPLANLDQATLDRLFGAGRDVERVYPLSPTQQGLLFHTLLSPGSENYFVQLTWTLHGRLDERDLADAWQGLLDRHPVLRTRFIWDNLSEPLQVVHRCVSLPWVSQDWRGMPADEQQVRLEAWLAADRALGFNLARQPLMRAAVLRLDETTYQCVWSVHHLLLDGWSTELLLKELFLSLRARMRGQAIDAELVPPPAFEGYIGWLRRQDPQGAEEYWTNALSGVERATPLTFGDVLDPGRTAEAGTRAERRVDLPAATTEALASLARRYRVTLSTIFNAAWAILLSRTARTEDVIFGTTVSGRPSELPGVESMIGMFINTLPVRVRVDPHARVGAWLKQLRIQQDEMSQYEHCALLDVQRWSGLPRGEPLFESILIVENFPAERPWQQRSTSHDAADLQISGGRGVGRTHYPLELVVYPDVQLAVEVGYDQARFGPEAVDGILRQLRTILEQMVADPELPVRELSLLGAVERAQVVTQWNATHRDYPREVCAPALVDLQAQRTPDAIAVRCGDAQLTYAELNQRANQLAHFLKGLGVGPESIVGIYAERSLDLAVALLGTLKAGAAYLPLDPVHARGRLASMLEDAGVRVLLTQAHLLEELETPGPAVRVCLDRDWPAIAAGPTSAPDLAMTTDHLAYVIYTSGSTGRPKGVMISHRSLVNHAISAARVYGIGVQDRVLQFASIGFDAAVEEIYPTWFRGGTLVLRPGREIGSIAEFTRLVEREQITVLDLPTAFWHTWVSEIERGQAEVPSCVRLVIAGGERVLPERVAAWRSRVGPKVRWCDTYGPTETTVVATLYEPKPDEDYAARIGRPVANTRTYVLDERLQPVPVGVPGELCIGGDGVARGYLHRPDLTAERFVPDPFGTSPGQRLYRSGDLVRWRTDGMLEFLGRLDNQVKIRGFRIELGEIEAVLARHPAVQDVVVVTRQTASGDPRVLAYVVPRTPGAAPASDDLRAHARQLLPEFMLPSAFIMLDALPLSPSGKVDRRALPEPDPGERRGGQAHVAPSNAVEEVLVAIWSDVLELPPDRVGTHDNFFELGGHSLLATQIVSRVRELLQAELPLRALFEAPTPAGLAAALLQNGETRAAILRTAELLLMLADLSDDEAEAMLE